jgi:hypothetical protein
MPASGKSAGTRPGGGGFRHMERFAGGPRGAMSEFLYPYAWRDVVFKREDFDQKAIDTGYWTTNAGTGATAFAVGSPWLNGVVNGATGTDATAGNRVVNLYGPPIYKGDNFCGLAFRLQVSAVTSIEWGVGFIDTHTTITTPVVGVPDIDTPTFAAGMGDAALIYQDTAETLATAALVCLGSGALNTGSKDALGTYAPTAATYFQGRIQLGGDGNTVTASVSEGNGPETTVTRPSGMEGGTLVRPFVVISGVTATSRTWTLDYLHVWQDR